MKIQNPSQEQFPVQTSELGDVRHPTLIGTLSAELTADQIRARSRTRFLPRPPFLTAMRSNQTAFGHHPRHAFAADTTAVFMTELTQHSRRPVGPQRRFMNVEDLDSEINISQIPVRQRAGQLWFRERCEKLDGVCRSLRRDRPRHRLARRHHERSSRRQIRAFGGSSYPLWKTLLTLWALFRGSNRKT